MSDDALVQALAGVDLFDGLSSRVIKHIASEGTIKSFDANAPVTEEGEGVTGWASFSPKGVCFYVILEGSADVAVDGVSHGSLSAGQYFGETSLIDGKPRSASVVAGPDGMRAFAITAWHFKPILEEHASVALALLQVMAARLRAAEARH